MTPRLRPLPDASSGNLSQGSGGSGDTAAPSRMRQARHLLVIPEEVEVEEVELLALSRFPSTRWEVPPAPGRGDLLDPGQLRTSRYTTLIGPFARPALIAEPNSQTRASAGLTEPGFVFDVGCPRERGERPFPGGPDRDGIARSFPDGLPVREEARVVQWVIAAARRLGGAVVFDGNHVVAPDPDALIDLTVFSDVWLEPEAALVTVRAIDPNAVFAPDGEDWAGPPPGEETDPAHEADAVKIAIHAVADEFDIEMLTSQTPATGYAIHVDLGPDGLIAIEIGGEESLPTSLAGLPWADDGALAYRVRWFPEEFTDLELADPPPAHRAARHRASLHIAAIARALHHVVSGEIADQENFLINPGDL